MKAEAEFAVPLESTCKSSYAFLVSLALVRPPVSGFPKCESLILAFIIIIRDLIGYFLPQRFSMLTWRNKGTLNPAAVRARAL